MKEFVMRGKTASGTQEVLNFSGFKPGMAYKMTEFKLYPGTSVGTANAELAATVTAAKTFEDPSNPNFNNEGLIGTAYFEMAQDNNLGTWTYSVVNDTFLITQNLILAVVDTVPGAPMDVNWQCRFESVKMSSAEEAVTNYKQYLISDE
tara:strand:- start:103 stop:549 length:447 start_codon:yes stop_codon:yes gene_type:complete